MNAIDILKKDHQEVQRLFSEFMSADEDDFDRREDLFQQIDKALTTHSDAEEQIFYPSVEKHASDQSTSGRYARYRGGRRRV